MDLGNGEKNCEKVFCFLDNCIVIGFVKISQLQRDYLSSAVNVLINSLTISRITKRDISNSISVRLLEKYAKSVSFEISIVFKAL